jgi:tetratricopeptide (TPR) repeat protein
LWLLLAGMLTVMSLFPVVLVLSMLILVAGLVMIGRERTGDIDVVSVLRAARHSAAAAVGGVKARLIGRNVRSLVPHIRRADPNRDAAALNKRGRQLRRDGKPEEAAAEHRAALAIVQDLGDRRAEALTRNYLGLALSLSGAEDAAVEQLELAIIILRALGEREHEARVIANLALVQQRRGHREAAVVLLHEALDKLPRESRAYRRVEDALVRTG